MSWAIVLEGSSDSSGILFLCDDRQELESIASEVRKRSHRVVVRPYQTGSGVNGRRPEGVVRSEGQRARSLPTANPGQARRPLADLGGGGFRPSLRLSPWREAERVDVTRPTGGWQYAQPVGFAVRSPTVHSWARTLARGRTVGRRPNRLWNGLAGSSRQRRPYGDLRR
jgi:hypothetical protein